MLIAGGKDTVKGDRAFVDPYVMKPVFRRKRRQNHETYTTRTSRNSQETIFGSIQKKAQDNSDSEMPDLTLFSSVTQCPLNTRGDKILFLRILQQRLHPKIVLKNTWQVQHDEEVQLQSNTEQSCAEGDPFQIDLCVQEEYRRMQYLKIKYK